MSGPLDGIRILDMSQWQQGPYATVVLSDFGADVIKVERPHYGDAGRHGFGGLKPDEVAPDFFAHNRGKRGITVQLGHPEGRDVILKLAEQTDVCINNFRFGVMEKWGLGYEDFRAVNPGIIYAHASGSGKKGPDVERPMFDIVAQALGGIMSVNGEEGRPPTPVGTFIADQTGATMLAVAILAALVAKERTGEGQSVDVSLLGSQLAMQSCEITHYLFKNEPPRRAGRGHPHLGVLWNTFPASDGYFTLAGVREDLWAEFCDLLGEPSLATDDRFNTVEGRSQNRGALIERLDAVFKTKPIDHWTGVLSAIDLACGRVRGYDEVVADEQVLANDYITTLDHPELGSVRIVNTPVSFSGTPGGPKGLAPELGQHTEEVLLEFGYDWPDIIALRDAGAI